jgi:HD-GYP domain-containing protein (c-di-GMP phosphodiesterase class II)
MNKEKDRIPLTDEDRDSMLKECRSAYSRRTDQFTRLLQQSKELTGKLRRNFEGMVELLNDVIAQADPAMGGHAKRGAALARRVAYAMRLNPDRRRLVFYAASLHDLSLIGSPKEWQRGEGDAWTSHPARSAEMIASVENLSRLAAVVGAHHECWDGSGFPEGSAGEAIPLESRIVAAVVAYDRKILTGGSSPEDVVSELESGGTCDTAVLKVLRKIIHTSSERRKRGDRLLTLDELAPGMLLADDLLLQSGLVLFPRETILDEETLTRIRSFGKMLPEEGLIRIFSR